jgi:hypothetical protein
VTVNATAIEVAAGPERSRLCESILGLGVEYLQVKTLGPSHPSRGYAATRRFYEALGFRPLEEIHGLWAEDNPCLLLVKRLG